MAGDELLRRDERDVRHWDETVDVLVVGFGCAGACAAIEAAEAGARVLVVDRSGGPGGTSINSGGFLYLGGGTALQKALGYEDSPQNMFDYMMAACGPDPDEALIAPYCEESAAHFDWVVARGVRRPRGARDARVALHPLVARAQRRRPAASRAGVGRRSREGGGSVRRPAG